MKRYSKETEEFIYKNVLPKLKLTSITEDNISQIVDYIVDNYEIPLSQAEEAKENIDSDLLEKVTRIVTEITTREDW